MKNVVWRRRNRPIRRRRQFKAAWRPGPRGNRLLLCASALAVACGYGGACQAAPTLSVLYSFTNLRGSYPAASLIADAAGNLYGTTLHGGTNSYGVVFELSPPAAGKTAWTEKVLKSFRGPDGEYPDGNLISDGAGNLYGMAGEGGTDNEGLVFELIPPVAGKTFWTERQILSFNGANGKYPEGVLIADGAGNLYGATGYGGAYGDGLVFELSPPLTGKTLWTEKVLFSFSGRNGAGPSLGLMDAAGNLYGTGDGGAYDNHGVAFELSPPAEGQSAWTETVLYSFGGPGHPGSGPSPGLIADSAGNLYGTTYRGGTDLYGAVFELIRPVMGQTAWTHAVLFSFNKENGAYPEAGLIADSAGNLYGTTSGGGTHNRGVVFELSPPVAGQTAWTETVLQSFDGTNGDGPLAGLLSNGAGDLYGTTCLGGAHEAGVVFKLTP